MALQAVTAIALAIVGWWISRNPRKTLLLYGNVANQPGPQKIMRLMGAVAVFVGVYSAIVIVAGPYLPEGVAGLPAAAAAVIFAWRANQAPA